MSYRPTADAETGRAIVSAYAQKKAQQMERARQLRAERAAQRARDAPHDDPPPPVAAAAPAAAPATLGLKPRVAAAVTLPQQQQQQPRSYSAAPAVSGLATPGRAHGSSHYQKQQQQQQPQPQEVVDEPLINDGATVAVGVSDLQRAVQAGIITMDQCAKLWDTFCQTGDSVLTDDTDYDAHESYTHRSTPAAYSTPAAAKKQPQHPQQQYGAPDIVDPARMSRQLEQAQERLQTQDDDWNHDTDLRYNDPEPDEVFIRKTSNPKPRREPKKAALPEWQSTADDEDVGFGAPPPLRKPAAKKTASRVPKTDRSNGSAPSYGGDAGGGGGGGCLVNLDDMPVGGGGGGKQPKLPSSRIPSFAKKAAKAAPRQAAAAPPAPAYQNDAYDAYGQPDAYGGGGGGLDIDSLPIHAAAGQDNFEQEAMQAANEPQQQCNQCGRSFRASVLVKHAAKCGRQKPRRVFDTSKQRELPDAKNVMTAGEPVAAKPKAGGWKAQHEDFQRAMKSNKLVVAVENGDLPESALQNLPQPKDTRVPCPHCTRRFAPDVAERHIPKCKNTIHKPKSVVRRY